MISKKALVALSLVAIASLVGAAGCSADPIDGSDEEESSESSVASSSEQGLTMCTTGTTSCLKGVQLKCGRYCGPDGPTVYQSQAVCVEGKWYCSSKRTYACKYSGVAACG